MNLKIDRDFTILTLAELVRINSINPSLSPEGKGEAEIGAYIADLLNSFGMQVTTYEIEPARVNVVGILKGSGGGKSLLMNAHMDTVGVEGMIGDSRAIKDWESFCTEPVEDALKLLTAKPAPASPALAASTAAFKASRLV